MEANLLPSFRSLKLVSRKAQTLNAQNLGGFLEFNKNRFDFDVWLAEYDCKLQRGDVWTFQQRQEYILSVIYWRYLPPFAINRRGRGDGTGDILQVVDGRQRLTALLNFLEDIFPIRLSTCDKSSKDFYYSKLPRDWKAQLSRRSVAVQETEDLTEKELLDWFYFINVAGTPVDTDHLRYIEALRNGGVAPYN